jgi:predicted amidohydrolase
MKIALAQIKSLAGDVSANTLKHIDAIKLAAQQGADIIVFPELSLTNYEPTLSIRRAAYETDEQFDLFRRLSDSLDINIVLGVPLKSNNGVHISCLVFQPSIPVKVYHKQMLHSDEEPFFIPGNEQLIFCVNDQRVAPAICFESLQNSHVQTVVDLGAEIYLALVSKPSRILDKAFEHYSMIAKKYNIPVVMVNGVGTADNFIAAGNSAYWKQDGSMVASLDQTTESILLVDIKEEKGATFAIKST